MPAIVSREAIEELRDKYAKMLAMRLAHDVADQSATERRARMAELSSRFPGALREMDDLELGEIGRRIAALDLVLRGGSDVERWMEAMALFHALARGALCAKRWLAKRKHVDTEVQLAFAVEATTLAFPEDARAWVDDLASIASPRRGRVTDAVFGRVARELGTNERTARLLVFGVSRRDRRDHSR